MFVFIGFFESKTCQSISSMNDSDLISVDTNAGAGKYVTISQYTFSAHKISSGKKFLMKKKLFTDDPPPLFLAKFGERGGVICNETF